MTTRTEAASRARQVLQSVKDRVSQTGGKVNEATTRAHFLNPLLAALGYESIEDVLFEYYLPDGKTFLDYRLVVGGKPRVAVEAKGLDVPITDTHAAQAVSYAAILGDEWAVVTNAREWRLYHAFAQAPLADKLILKADLIGWDTDAQFESVFEQLWLISKDRFEAGEGPGTWVTSKKLDQLMREVLTDPTTAEVRYLRRQLEHRGVETSAEHVAAWLRGRLDSDARASQAVGRVLIPATPTDYPTSKARATPRRAREPGASYPSGTGYWLIPAGRQRGFAASEHLRNWLDRGFWGFGPATPGRKHIKPGDRVCFYAAKSQQILAHATISGVIDVPVQSNEWPGPDSPHGLTYKVPLVDIVWLDEPVRVDTSLRSALDAFRGRNAERGWSWLVQTTRRVSEADFRTLTRANVT